MTDKKFTDEEIIKALEDYIKENEFEYFHSNMMGEYPLIRKSLDLINRQKSEIEKLNIQLQEWWNTASLYKAESEMWDNYNKNLLTANTALSNEILEAKAEAYKEFAKTIKTTIKVHAVEALLNSNASYDVVNVLKDIDVVLKEMVGEEE